MTKLSSLCKCLISTKFGSTVALCLPARVVARSSTPNNSINRHTKFVCDKPHHRKSFCHFSMWGKDNHWGHHPQSDHVGGGGEEEYGSSQFQEEGTIHYPFKWKSIVLVFNRFVCVMYIFYLFFLVESQDFKIKLIINFAINKHIIHLLYGQNIYIWDSS